VVNAREALIVHAQQVTAIIINREQRMKLMMAEAKADIDQEAPPLFYDGQQWTTIVFCLMASAWRKNF
jgi:hypothetical protein